MRLSSSDLIFVTISAFLAAALLTLFFLDTPKTRGGKEGKPIGQITFKKKTAERKSENEVVWEQVVKTSPLYNGDAIRTVEAAAADIRLSDGTEIKLTDESLIVLDLSSSEVNINFLHGNISAKKNAGGQKVRLTTAEGRVSLASSTGEISVAKNEKQEGFKLAVSEGRAEITGKSGRAVIDEGRSATLRGAAEPIRIERASLLPTAPAANASLLAVQASVSVDFSWKNPGHVEAVLIVAADREIQKIEARKTVSGESSSLELGPGVHYWSLQEKNDSKASQELSAPEPRKLEILRDPGLRKIAPDPDERFRYFQRAPVVQLVWSENALAESYTVQVAADPEFKDVVYRKETRETRITLVKLSEGRWYWKVGWKIELPGVSQSSETSVSSFVVEREKSPSPPTPVSPAGSPAIRYEDFTNQGIFLSWTSGRELAKYRLEISDDAAFDKVVIRRDQPENFLSLREGLRPGPWNWRVVLLAKMEDDSILPVPGPARSFTILSPEPVAAPKAKSGNPAATNNNVEQTNSAVVSNVISNTTTPAVRSNEVKPVLPVIREALPVRTNDNAMLYLQLSPADALIELRNLSSNCEVNAVPGRMELPPGEYQVRGQKRGHHAFELRFLLTNRESRELRIALREILTESEKLILVDGSSVSGKIVDQNTDEITIETAAGLRKISRDDIENVIYIRKK